MKIYHKDLWVVRSGWSWKNCFEYSNQAELAVANLLALPDPTITQGNFPGYDFESAGVKYEVKFQNTVDVRIEHHQAKSGKPSGILTSTADKWIVISKGWTNQRKLVGKIRSYDPAVLRNIVERSPGESNFVTKNPKNVEHEWLGDVLWNDEQQYWDLSRWTRVGRR
jgi:hypothetical protein